jgi:hypothetical protein
LEKSISCMYLYCSCSTPPRYTSSYILQETKLPYGTRRRKIEFKHGDQIAEPQPRLDAQEHRSHIMPLSREGGTAIVSAATAESDQHHIYQVCLPTVLTNTIK